MKGNILQHFSTLFFNLIYQTQQNLNDGPFLGLMPCCVCIDQTSEVTLHPCGHLKVCRDCWSTIVDNHNTVMARFLERDLEEDYRPQLKCPFCNDPIKEFSNKIFT